jgi:SAM-dependent methyltransferase
MFEFTCNICGFANSLFLWPEQKHRELINCMQCRSTARHRGVVHAVQKALLNDTKTPLAFTDVRKSYYGIGMSDSEVYAQHLDRIFTYTNTLYHAEPHLDVSNSNSCARYKRLDFVISSDVLEHVDPPVSEALRNIRGMLKASGHLILTAPFLEGYETIEHFPHLNQFSIANIGESFVLLNRRRDEHIETFQHLSFHGGPGSVLEMRIFGLGDLLARLSYAGFSNVEVIRANLGAIGYVWDEIAENPLSGGRRFLSYVILCRA